MSERVDERDASPFVKDSSNNEYLNSWSYALRIKWPYKAKLILLRNFPFLKELPAYYVLPTGTLILTVLIACFAVLFHYGYTNTKKTKFLSPSSQSDDSSQQCEEIAVSNTGQFMATKSNGAWEGTELFEYSKAAYLLTVTNFKTTPDEFADIMWAVYDSLAEIGELFKKQDLAENLLFWMSLTFTTEKGNVQRLDMIGNALTVFKRQYTTGIISNVDGDCSVASLSSFDAAGNLVLSYNYNIFSKDSICMSAADPYYLGYVPGLNSDQFTIRIDVRALATSMAINNGIIYLEQLVMIPGTQQEYTYDGQVYNISSYYDPKYPGMTELVCIADDAIRQCIFKIGNGYALPVFNHAGNNFTLPEPCDCETLTQEELDNPYTNCNLFSFLSGFIFWNNYFNPDGILELVKRYNYNLKEINRLAYNATFTASYFGTSSPYYEDELNVPTVREADYNFCNISIGPCSIITFSSFDVFVDNFGISDYYYQLRNGACNNSITPSREAWRALIHTPFAPLNQPYDQCNLATTQALVTQTGVTFANIAVIAPIAALLIGNLVGALCLSHCGRSADHNNGNKKSSDNGSYNNNNNRNEKSHLSDSLLPVSETQDMDNTGSAPATARGTTTGTGESRVRETHTELASEVSYSFSERESALNSLAVALLRARDRNILSSGTSSVHTSTSTHGGGITPGDDGDCFSSGRVKYMHSEGTIEQQAKSHRVKALLSELAAELSSE